MHLFHHYHTLHKHRDLHSDFWLFELSVWLHVFGRALIAVFIPILLLQLDYALDEVMLYYFVYCIFNLPLNFFARWLTRKLGARAVITLGTVASVIFFGILFHLGSGDWILLTSLALAAALYDTFYWVAHIYFFMESSKKRASASKDTGLLNIARRLGGLLAPAFGALILIFFSRNVLILISVGVLLLSILPLMKAKGVADRPPTQKIPFRAFFRSRSDLRDYILMSFYGVHGSVEAVLWPIFLYVLFASIESVAVIPIIVSLTAIFFTYFAGRIHRRDRSTAMVIGGLLLAVTWILRVVLDLPVYYYASIFLVGLFTILVSIPLDSSIYERGERVDPLTAATYRNFFAMLLKCVLYGTLFLLLNVFQVSFITAAGSMVVVALVAFFVKETPLLTEKV